MSKGRLSVSYFYGELGLLISLRGCDPVAIFGGKNGRVTTLILNKRLPCMQ